MHHALYTRRMSNNAMDPIQRIEMRESDERTGSDNIEHIEVMLSDETIEVRIDQGETWAGTPVSEKTGFDIIKSNLAFNKEVVLEEDHSYKRDMSATRRSTSNVLPTCGDIVRRPAETLDILELLRREDVEVELDGELAEPFWELGLLGRRIRSSKDLSGHRL